MISSTYHVHAALKLAPILNQNSQEMQVVRTICSTTAKTSTVTLIFVHSERSDFIILSRAKRERSLLIARCLSQLSKFEAS